MDKELKDYSNRNIKQITVCIGIGCNIKCLTPTRVCLWENGIGIWSDPGPNIFQPSFDLVKFKHSENVEELLKQAKAKNFKIDSINPQEAIFLNKDFDRRLRDVFKNEINNQLLEPFELEKQDEFLVRNGTTEEFNNTLKQFIHIAKSTSDKSYIEISFVCLPDETTYMDYTKPKELKKPMQQIVEIFQPYGYQWYWKDQDTRRKGRKRDAVSRERVHVYFNSKHDTLDKARKRISAKYDLYETFKKYGKDTIVIEKMIEEIHRNYI